MSGQGLSVTKKIGRPRKEPSGLVRLPISVFDAVDGWIAGRPEPRPSRPEAIRRLVEQALASTGLPQSDASLDRQIADQEAAIAQMPSSKARSPEAALAVMDKALAKNELVKMKNKRAHRQSASRKTMKPRA